MTDFKIHTVDSAPDGSQALLRGLKDQVGFVPNLAGTMAGSPALLEAFLGLRSAAAKSSLDPIAREIVAISVAAETHCSYCVAAHSTFALKLGASGLAVEAARAGAPLADPRLQALARFARAVVIRKDVAPRAEELLKAGSTPAELLDVLVAIAVPMLASSVFHAAGVALDAAFQPQAWAGQAGRNVNTSTPST